MPRKRLFFIVALVVFTALYAAASLLMRQGVALTLIGDLGQCFIQTALVITIAMNLRAPRPEARVFWWMLTAGSLLWLVAQGIWTYYESIMQIAVPSAYLGDLLFFLHVVPFIAATSLRPHLESTERSRRFSIGYLDFALLLVWWVFLYAYVVGPWQFVRRDELTFGTRYNLLYAIENFTAIAGFALLWLRSSGQWKRAYAHFLGASATYGVASLVLNIAIDRKAYFTGSLFDVPLVISMCWYAYAGYFAATSELEPDAPTPEPTRQTNWQARLAALALFSLPIFATWANLDYGVIPEIQRYRMFLTMIVMLILVMLVSLKQDMLQQGLISLLGETRKSFEDLRRMQDQLLQSEKLASIGRLVAGAAHEINNPLTAILGYSSLLAEDPALPPGQQDAAAKIMAQARRTKTLVSSLLTFAAQSPMQRALLDLNAVINNAVQLQELERADLTIKIERDLAPQLPPIFGDTNHMLQMCFHILKNAMEAMQERDKNGTVTLSTRFEHGQVVFRCADTGPGIDSPKNIFDPFYTTKAVGQGMGMGLSACYGIVRDHGGSITCENRAEGGALFTILLPAAPLTSVQMAQAAHFQAASR